MSFPSVNNVISIKKLKSLKGLDKDSIIYKLSNDIENLNIKVFQLTQKNLEYKKLLKDYSTLKDKIKVLEDELKNTNKEKIKLIKEKDDKNSELFNKVNSLENKIVVNKLDYDKNTILYQQKMSVFNHIRMENQVYAEEAAKFEKEKELYKKQKDNEVEKYRVHSLLKYQKFKQKMFDDLEKINENLLDINSDYISLSHKLTILKNRQLILQIGELETAVKELETENKEMKRKIYEFGNDVNIHKLVEKNLTEKIGKKNIIKLTRNNSDFNRSENNLTFDFRLKSYNLNNVNNFNKSNGTGSISTNTIMTKNPSLEKRIINYKKIIEEKSYDNEKLILINSHLKNQLDIYHKKYNGLFTFLEESLSNFCHDEEISTNKNYYLKLDKMPLITINFNSTSNIGKDLFKTNLNIVNRKFNLNETFLKDETLRNAFLDKKNRIFKDVLNPRRTQFSSSVPVLKRFNDINLNFYDKKNKVLI